MEFVTAKQAMGTNLCIYTTGRHQTSTSNPYFIT